MKHFILLTGASLLALAACETTTPPPVEPAEPPVATETPTPVATPTPAETPVAYDYSSALASDLRTEEDLDKDEARLPAETLAFTGVEPGDAVLELEAGGGYFTSLLAAVVGDEGMVYMQNPQEFDSFWGGGDPPRLVGLPETVSYLRTDFDDFSALPDESIDVVTWIMGPHELWYTPDGSDGLGEADPSFAEIARVLKSGGVLVMQDHKAPAGSPPTTGGDTHRIDPAIIDGLATENGLVLTESSDLFAHPDDDLTMNVFAPEVRGKTDQFLVKYVKE